MKQSRAMSLVESIANVLVGYGVAVMTQILVFPLFGLHTSVQDNLTIGARPASSTASRTACPT